MNNDRAVTKLNTNSPVKEVLWDTVFKRNAI